MTDRGASYVRLQQALDQAAQQMAQATAAAAAAQQGPPPASTSALKRIPIVRVAADDLTKDNECCTICLEDHVPGELAARLLLEQLAGGARQALVDHALHEQHSQGRSVAPETLRAVGAAARTLSTMKPSCAQRPAVR